MLSGRGTRFISGTTNTYVLGTPAISPFPNCLVGTAALSGYQVNVKFSVPTIYVNLYQGNTQAGHIDVDDPALIPLVAFAMEQMASNDNVSWNEIAEILHFGMEETGEG